MVLEAVASIEPESVDLGVRSHDFVFKESDEVVQHSWLDWWRFRDSRLSVLTEMEEGKMTGAFGPIAKGQQLRLALPTKEGANVVG